MFRVDEKILMVFKKDVASYKFHSVEVAHKNKKGHYIGQSGMFKGKEIILVPEFRTNTDAALVWYDSARLLFLTDYNEFSIMDEYVIYEVPKKLYEILKNYQVVKGDAVAHEILCELGKTTDFVHKKGGSFLVLHTYPQKPLTRSVVFSILNL